VSQVGGRERLLLCEPLLVKDRGRNRSHEGVTVGGFAAGMNDIPECVKFAKLAYGGDEGGGSDAGQGGGLWCNILIADIFDDAVRRDIVSGIRGRARADGAGGAPRGYPVFGRVDWGHVESDGRFIDGWIGALHIRPADAGEDAVIVIFDLGFEDGWCRTIVRKLADAAVDAQKSPACQVAPRVFVFVAVNVDQWLVTLKIPSVDRLITDRPTEFL
jgi:hypothetical protein